MVLDDDLDLQLAWKGLFVLVFVIGFLAVLGVSLWFILSSLPTHVPLFPAFFYFPFPSLGVSKFYIEVLLFFDTMVSKFIINFPLFLVEFDMSLCVWVGFSIAYAYTLLIVRLSRKGSYTFWFGMFSTKPSDRYKTFGEAKNRINQILRNGTGEEKSAINHFIVSTVAGWSVGAALFLLIYAEIPPFDLLSSLFSGSKFIVAYIILLAFVYQGYFFQKRLWDRIQ